MTDPSPIKNVVSFCSRIARSEKIFVKLLNEKKYDEFMAAVEAIKKETGICVDVSIGPGIINGGKFEERKGMYEFNISSGMSRTNIKNIDSIYDRMTKMHPSKVFHYSKYKPLIRGRFSKIEYEDIVVDLKDFSFWASVNKDVSDLKMNKHVKYKIDLFLFVSDSIYDIHVKEGKPCTPLMISMLLSIAGEHAVLNMLEDVIIYKKSDATRSMKSMDQLAMIINVAYGDRVKYCSRCLSASFNRKLQRCSCKFTYYCDRTCQIADRPRHKHACTRNDGPIVNNVVPPS